MLKLLNPDSDELPGIEALARYDGRGAVRLVDRSRRAMLLERIEPGRHLTGLVLDGNDDRATGILCDVMQALHRVDPFSVNFPSVKDWGEGFKRYDRAGPLEIMLVDIAESIYGDLCAVQDRAFLLHGDLQHDNVLYDAQRGWLAIDPKGVAGERAYETGAMLRNPTGDPTRFADPRIIDRRASILCERLALDRILVLHWCFAQAVLAAIWAFEDGVIDQRGIVTAEATLPLLRSRRRRLKPG